MNLLFFKSKVKFLDFLVQTWNPSKFVEEHGEVCPANWKPGAKTINPAKANEYFESANE